MTTPFRKKNEFVDNTPGEVSSGTVRSRVASMPRNAPFRYQQESFAPSAQQLPQKWDGDAPFGGEGGGVDSVEQRS